MTMIAPYDVGQRATPDGPVLPPNRQQIARVNAALAGLDDDVVPARLLPFGARVLFGWVDFLPGTHERAAGYTISRRTTLVRWGMADAPNLSVDAAIAVVLHETLGHARLAQVPLTLSQMEQGLALLGGPPIPAHNSPWDVWRQAPGDVDLAKAAHTLAYWFRPYENLIASMVAALTGGNIKEPWFGKYQRTVPPGRWPDLKALWLNLVANTPVVDPEINIPSEPPPAHDWPTEVALLTAQRDALVQGIREAEAQTSSAAAQTTGAANTLARIVAPYLPAPAGGPGGGI